MVADLHRSLLARELPFGDGWITVLTADCLRLDVITEQAGQVPTSAHRDRLAVLDAAKLTSEQRDVLSAMPAVAAEPDSLRSGMWATVEAWNRKGRVAAESIGVRWPVRLADTVTHYFEQHCRDWFGDERTGSG